MFDIGMWELLVVGTVALLVVGPKELPGLLRTIGKYAGMMKRQANDFKAQFNEAIQESEFQELKRDVESLGDEAEADLREAGEELVEGMGEFDDEDLMEEEFDDFDLEEAITTDAAKPDKAGSDKAKTNKTKPDSESADSGDQLQDETAANTSSQPTDTDDTNVDADGTEAEAESVNGVVASNGHDIAESAAQSSAASAQRATTGSKS